jgi:hypothetical protein
VLQAIATLTNPIQSVYLLGLQQYGIQAKAGLTGQSIIVTSPEPPNPFTTNNVGNKIWDLIDAGAYPEPEDAAYPNFYIVVMPPGVVPTNNNINGAHSSASDYDFLQGTESLAFAWVRFGTLDQITFTLSHELVEAMTDPYGNAVQVNPRNSQSWNELGDVGASSGRINGILVSSYFSAKAGACIIPTAPPPPPPALPPGAYRIDCVTHWSHNGNQYIGLLGGALPDGTHWKLPESVVISLIRNASCSFFTDEGGRQADVVIEKGPTGLVHLTTIGDGFSPNNLGSLGTCT